MCPVSNSISPPRRFKGWAVPGPIPDRGLLVSEPRFQVSEDETLDAIGGNFQIFQLKRGHRFSTDDLLVAWYGTTYAPSALRILDLGSGIGSVATLAAFRCPASKIVSVETQKSSIDLARRSCEWNQLQDRYEIREGDLRDPKVIDQTEFFDLVLGSPPYFPLSDGLVSDHPQKQACRFEMKGGVEDYIETASRHLSPSGVLALVFPVQPQAQWDRVSRAAILKQGEEPLLGLFLLAKQDDLGPFLREPKPFVEAPLTIRLQDQSIDPEYRRVKFSLGFPPE
jgi:tRNA1Val (adenine37-N6)-methyltransferase